MPTWDSQQYLRFNAQRTRPAEDLAARTAVDAPRTVVDLGCGPGNSTAIVAQRWPMAKVSGIDSSAEMIETARKTSASIDWSIGDIATWSPSATYDVVFSNAALQWVPDHETVLPKLFSRVATGGAFAFQVPANFDAPGHQLIRKVGSSDRWRGLFTTAVREWHVEPVEFYYDVLAPLSTRLDLWLTDYIHILPGPEAIVEWYRGTGLRPWLDALPDEETRSAFVANYLTEITAAFPRQRDGNVLFPFRRLFAVAYR